MRKRIFVVLFRATSPGEPLPEVPYGQLPQEIGFQFFRIPNSPQETAVRNLRILHYPQEIGFPFFWNRNSPQETAVRSLRIRNSPQETVVRTFWNPIPPQKTPFRTIKFPMSPNATTVQSTGKGMYQYIPSWNRNPDAGYLGSEVP